MTEDEACPGPTGSLLQWQQNTAGLTLYIRVSSVDPNSVNKCTLKNQTPLLLAASQGNASCVKFLLMHGANPNTANKDRDTPLFTGELRFLRVVMMSLRFISNCLCFSLWKSERSHRGPAAEVWGSGESLLQSGIKCFSWSVQTWTTEAVQDVIGCRSRSEH